MPRALTRVLTGDKVIESPLLNALGAQAFREVAARAVYRLRPRAGDRTVGDHVSALMRDGLLVLPGFLAPGHFADVLRECAQLDGAPDRTHVAAQGPNSVEVTRIRCFAPRTLGRTEAFFRDDRLCAILRAVETWPWADLAQYGHRERITYGPNDGTQETDPQSHLHADVFFHSHKVWLFLDEVRLEDGPFAYVKRSHRMTRRRLRWTYRDSRRRDPASDPSRRVSDGERQELDLEEAFAICPRNTLVIANVCGYHRRVQGRAGHQRRALAFSLRENPFLAHGLRARLSRVPRLYGALRSMKRHLAGLGVRS